MKCSSQSADQASFVSQEFAGQRISDELHEHDAFEVILVTHGLGTVQLGASCVDLVPSSLLVIAPKLQHAVCSRGESGLSGFVFHIEARAVSRELLALPEMAAVRGFLPSPGRALVMRASDRQRMATRMRSAMRAKGALSLARLHVMLELASGQRLLRVIENEEDKSISARDRARLARLRRFVEENYERPLSRAEAAAEIGLEEGSFSRFFGRAQGTSFRAYLISFRLQKAAGLLGSRRGLPVAEVARRCGFRNQSAFNRQFRRRLGTTPLRYRRSADLEPVLP